MLTHLNLENFKSWEKADLTFGRITGLFGTNSSGKSSLIQFLLLMKQTKEATDRATALDLNGAYVGLGTISDVIHRHDASRCLEFTLGIRRPNALEMIDARSAIAAPVATSADLKLFGRVGVDDMAPISLLLGYNLGDFAMFFLAPKKGAKDKFDLKVDAPGMDFEFIRSRGRPWDLQGPLKTYQFPDQARTYFQNAGFLADFETAFEDEMDSLFYLGPLREYPRRDYLWARSTPTGVGARGDLAIDAILAMEARGEKRNVKRKARLMPFAGIIAHWLRAMGLIHDFRVREIAKGSNRWQAKVITREGGTEVLLTDVGFGVSQILPVITLLYYVPEGSTVILEQPEIHLHPLAQAELADVIINVAMHRNVQVILESHSEHLLLRLQRRIAEGDNLSADDVKLYFCNTSFGMSTIEELEIDLLGNIKNWPDKFMGDAFTEAAKAELARLKRRKKSAA